MILKALCLVAVATVVSAGVGGKSTVKAVAKASKSKTEDGYLIQLDGGDSERECANARWYVRVGGVYVKVKDRMFAKYPVSDKPKTYKFKLLIWDPETSARKDEDYVYVEINGGNGKKDDEKEKKGNKKLKKDKSDKLFADADILKVTETKNGYEIKLSGDDSKNCDDYVWEYKTKQGYVAISQRENTKYEVEKEGKHKFRLICANDNIEEVDMDVTYVKIFDCKDPKFPNPDDNQGGDDDDDDVCKKSNKKHCDPCKGVKCKAVATVKDVNKVGNKYEIVLTAEGSKDCKKYEWERLRGNVDNENLGYGVQKKYTVSMRGEYKFRVTCYNNKCNDTDKDVVETDCVATYK